MRGYFNLVVMHEHLSRQKVDQATIASLHGFLTAFGPGLGNNVTWVHGRFEAMGIQMPERPVFPSDYQRWMDAIHAGLPMDRGQNAAAFDTFLRGKQLGYVHAGAMELIQTLRLHKEHGLNVDGFVDHILRDRLPLTGFGGGGLGMGQVQSDRLLIAEIDGLASLLQKRQRESTKATILINPSAHMQAFIDLNNEITMAVGRLL